jgi:hypothetical protein
LTVRRPRATNWAWPTLRVSERTVSDTMTSPGPARAHSLAAMLTAVPTGPSGVSTASPAWTPMPTRIGSSGWLSAATVVTMSRAQATARLADGKVT